MSKQPAWQQACVAVVGGGAAGLAAAIEAATALQGQAEQAVVLLEGQTRIGRKILATGNGRCNLSHQPLDLAAYHATDPLFIQPVLSRYGLAQTLAWFEDLGLPHRIDEHGRVYPYSRQASAVLDVLRLRLEQLPVALWTDQQVQALQETANGFTLQTQTGQRFQATCVVVATGGLAGPAFGCDGSGYRLMQTLGHQLLEPRPAVAQLCTETKDMRGLAGIKLDASLVLAGGGQPLRREQGEVLLTTYGLSGPPVLQLARAVQQHLHQHPAADLVVQVDLLPGWPLPDLLAWLTRQRTGHPDRSLEHLWTGLLHKKCGLWLTKKTLSVSLSRPFSALDERDLLRLARAAKQQRFTVTGTTGWREAQVTSGGLSLADFDPDTLQSRLVKGLFAAGEILDVDGDCGGYNLQWAWSSGRCAGAMAAQASRP